MLLHASCAALGGEAVLLTGPPGSGKSDLALRLLDLGFTLVADDQVVVTDGVASAPDALRGLLEIRGVGIVQMEHLDAAPVRLVARLGQGVAARLPRAVPDAALGLPAITLDAFGASAALRVRWALGCATGLCRQIAGFAVP